MVEQFAYPVVLLVAVLCAWQLLHRYMQLRARAIAGNEALASLRTWMANVEVDLCAHMSSLEASTSSRLQTLAQDSDAAAEHIKQRGAEIERLETALANHANQTTAEVARLQKLLTPNPNNNMARAF